VTALAAVETHLRRQRGIPTPYTIADAVAVLVKFRDRVSPNPEWREAYRTGLDNFRQKVESH
jgi:hypothetical protein